MGFRKQMWANTDTKLRPDDCRGHNIDREIPIHVLGRWGSLFNDSQEYLDQVSRDGLQANILELKWLMSRRRIDRKTSPLPDRILRVLMRGEEQISEIQEKLKR